MDAEPFAPLPRALLEGFADCLWEMDADGTIVSGGPLGAGGGADAGGGGPWRDRNWLEMLDPADRGPADALWRRALMSAEPAEATVRLCLSGRPEPVRLRFAPAAGEEGHWHALGRRIAPEESDDAHRRLIETIDDGFCTLELLRDAEGQAYDYRFLSVNSAFERQSGFSHAEGRTALQLVPDLPRRWLDIYSRIARTGRAERFEEAQEMPHRFFEVYATPVEPPGGSRLAVLFRDILPRKRAEEQLSASERRMTSLVQGMPQLVWRASQAGLWTWASPQWTEFTGQTAAESRGFGWLKAIHPDDRAEVVDRWRQAGERGEFQAEIRIRHPGRGVERWFQARAVPVRDDRGAAAEWIGTCTDIDERYQLQARQEVLLAELQHRTRNLLGVVASVAERTARSSRALDDFLPRLRERLFALSRINGLLSQLDRGQRVTFGELIRAELGARGVLDPASGERVVLEGPEGVRLRSASVQTFALAVHELATNAVKYGALSGDAGRLLVRWRLGEPAAGPRRLVVEWIESGVVMAARQAALPGGGYGRELIEKALPYQLKARTSYEIGPDGVRCTIDLPIDDEAKA